MADWTAELNAFENREKLVIVAFSKEDVEISIDRTLTDEQWGEVRRLFWKYDTSEMSNILCEIARDVSDKD